MRSLCWLAFGFLCALPGWAQTGLQHRVVASEGSPGDDHMRLVIHLHNPSPAPITVSAVSVSCGCTVLDAPATPWILAADERLALPVQIDLRGKRGDFQKTVRLTTSDGPLIVRLAAHAPEAMLSQQRLDNQLIALADARAIFRGDCARCHAEPARGVQGAALYQAACAICHEAEPRAESVPDLQLGVRARTAEEWMTWIADGAEGSLMPPFALARGGILDDAQIESLITYLSALPIQGADR